MTRNKNYTPVIILILIILVIIIYLFMQNWEALRTEVHSMQSKGKEG